jgi:AraC-like DNA-binding protein
VSSISNERISDSPYVATVWHGIAGESGRFIAPADGRWELIVKRHEGKTSLVVSGPVTKAVPSAFQAGTEILSIKFKLGTFMPYLPVSKLLDTRTILPEASSKTFWLNGSAWQFPDYDNADTFIDRLMRDDVLVYDPVVDTALQNQHQDWSIHTIRRRFLKATGFTQSSIRQIERARYAAMLLAQGTSILDTVYEAGYSDQPHLTRSLKRFIGQTPAQLIGIRSPE